MQARNHVAIVRSSEYATVKATFDELYKRQEAALARVSLTSIMQHVQSKAEKVGMYGHA